MLHIREAPDNDSEPDSGLLPSDIELVKYKTPSTSILGRGIHKMVTLFRNLQEVTRNNDLHELAENSDGDDDDDAFLAGLRQEQVAAIKHDHAHDHRAFQILHCLIPGFDKTLGDFSNCEQLHAFFSMLEKSANDAWAHDTKELKVVVINFINKELKPIPLIDALDRSCLGLQNGHIGYLICPVDIDWEDEQIRD
ncbi:hypothetical protein BDQ17DRAFT_1332208 [Cyathus striatus]|nr:hypothetical protein BDQ17DRAFT_1332208 [Cyathus striatus]